MVTIEENENQDILELRSRKVNKNVCRALWQVNHEQIQRDLDNEQSSMTEHYTSKYNFNFQEGFPLRGNYKWKKVGSSRVAQLQTRPTGRHEGKKQGRATVEHKRKSKTAKKDHTLMGNPMKVNKRKTGGTKPTQRRSTRSKSGSASTLGQQV